MSETWFDTRSGELLIGEAAAVPRLEEAGPDIVPLAELLTADRFAFKSTDFDSVNARQWSKDECIQVGQWTLNILNQAGYDRPLNSTHMRRLSILGLSPYVEYVSSQFGGFSKYKEAAGLAVRYSRTRYEDWGTAAFVQYAKQVKQRLGHLPSINDYKALFDAEKGPSFSMIEDRFGGVRKLHELLGYPDVSGWDQSDFVWWGVRVMRANPGKELSIHMVPFLASKHYGPSLWTIYKRCGTWSKFKTMAEEAYQNEQHETAQKLDSYHTSISKGDLPADFATLPDEELLAAAGRFRVLDDCLPSLGQLQKAKLALEPSEALIPSVRKRKSDITAGYVEMVAASKNVYDDIWPTDDNVESLFVPEDAIEAARRLNTIKKGQDRKKRQHTAA